MRIQLVATVAGGLTLTVLQILSGMALAPVAVDVPPDFLLWMPVSNLLIAGVLAWFARRSAWTGWRLAAALLAIGYGIGTASSLIEGYVFDIFNRPGEVRRLFVLTLVPATAFAPVMVLLTGRWQRAGAVATPLPLRGAIEWIARVAACSVAYLVLYFAAGMIIFPYVQEFYEQLTLPSTSTIILLQRSYGGLSLSRLGF